MIKHPLVVGVCIGILVLIVFLLLHAIKGKAPDLTEAITTILACAASISAFDCGRLLLKMSISLGDLENHRLTMILGALAVTG